MTVSEMAHRIVANIMLRDPTSGSNPHDTKLVFSKFEAILLCTCAGSLLEHKLFFLALRFKRLLRWGTLLWFPSTVILDLLVFGIVYSFLMAQSRWCLRTRIAGLVARGFATCFAVFVVVSCCTSILLLIETGMCR
jgi:hypothetical protein